jgi:hypothetical protein
MISYTEYLADPDAVLQQVRRDARRERAEVVHELIVAPLKRMFQRLRAQPVRRVAGAAS